MANLKLLGISGSLRKGSTNTKLLREAARLFGPNDFSLADLRMPLYDGDLEEVSGMPSEAKTLYAQMEAADAIIISTPEYNGNISGVLKNALDWVSREKPMAMSGKPVAILSAAAGRTGGARTQFSLRHCLTPFGPQIIQSPEVMIAASHSAFDEDGTLSDERNVAGLTKLMDALRAKVSAG